MGSISLQRTTAPVRIVVAVRRSHAAGYARILGALSLPVLVLTALGSHVGLVPQAALLPAVALGFLFGLMATGASIYALVDIWRNGADGLGAALAALTYSAPVLILTAAVTAATFTYPRIADITTDPLSPPRFVTGTGHANTPHASSLELQAEAYPEIATHLYAKPLSEVHAAALHVIDDYGWTITFDTGGGPPEATPSDSPLAVEGDELVQALAQKSVVTQSRGEVVAPTGPTSGSLLAQQDARRPLREATIQVLARTIGFGFRDDVVLRLGATPDGTLVDIRSASRIGEHDLGQNARRIAALFAKLDNTLYGAAGPPGGSSLAP